MINFMSPSLFYSTDATKDFDMLNLLLAFKYSFELWAVGAPISFWTNLFGVLVGAITPLTTRTALVTAKFACLSVLSG